MLLDDSCVAGQLVVGVPADTDVRVVVTPRGLRISRSEVAKHVGFPLLV